MRPLGGSCGAKGHEWNHEQSQYSQTQQVVGNVGVLRTVMEIDDPCDEAGTRSKGQGKRPENIQGEGTEIEMMLTKGDSHQGEEGHSHRSSFPLAGGKVQSSH